MSSEISTRQASRPRPKGGATAATRAAGAASTQARKAATGETGDQAASSGALRPWHLFVILGLAAASAGALTARGTSPANVIMLSLTIVSASGAAVALYRTLSPLVVAELEDEPDMLGGRTRAALEREKALVLRSIKELEFDRAMGKIAEPDFQDMIGRLRARAIGLIKQLDAGGAGYRDLIERELQARLGQRRVAWSGGAVPAGAGNGAVEGQPAPEEPAAAASALDAASTACSGCGTLNDADARFCKGCGIKLAVLA